MRRRYKALVMGWHDGDTLFFDIDLGFRLGLKINARLAGVDCPELGTPEGEAARDFVGGWIPGSGEVIVETELERDGDPKMSFQRYICHIYNDKKESLSEALIAAGHAKRWKR